MRDEATGLEDLEFRCSCCGSLHCGISDLAYSAPAGWDPAAGERDPEENWLTTDYCRIGDDLFIRCVLEVPVLGQSDRDFRWGVWLSQSTESFRRYSAATDADAGEKTFGYLWNALPSYPSTLSLKAMAAWRGENQRPLVELEDLVHRFTTIG